VAAHAPDVPPLDLLRLADLEPGRKGSLRFEAHPSVTLLRFGFPADHIADAILSGDEGAMAAIDLDSGPIAMVVHRGPDGVAAERISPERHRFLTRLFAGEDLSMLLSDETADAAQILAQQFALGRIAGCMIGDSSRKTETMR
jgi:hypothetical protein